MTETASFQNFMSRVRAGDDRAAEQLVRQYEPEIRREIRVRLTDPSLRRVIDSMDVCQSVLGDFFARAALGQFDLDEPRQLLQLLLSMARNRLTDWARHQTAQRRDARRDQSLAQAVRNGHEPLAADPSPSRVLAGKELLEQVRQRLTDDERRIADLRAADLGWPEIAATIGGTPEALRKRLSRALDRVANEIGL